MKKKLLNCLLVFSLLLITFFSNYISSYAASFAYKDFDWEEFAEKNKNYWTSVCDEEDNSCRDKILATKEKFYTQLYKLLANTPNNDKIDDNIIIATVFFGLDEETFRDPSSEYYSPYNIDESGAAIEDEVAYFRNETDTLKTLINAFTGYKAVCYGVSNETPYETTDREGRIIKVCPTNSLSVYNDKCVKELDNLNGNFFDSIGLSSFSGTDEKCSNLSKDKNFDNSLLITSNKKEVSSEFFYSFLEDTTYLDNKEHLSEYYISVLSSVKKTSMKDLTDEERNEHYDEILKVRQYLIGWIKDIVDDYEGITSQYNFKTVSSDLYWWPIGSDESTETNGKLMAIGDPSFVNVISNFGLRNDPITDEINSRHGGIDIPGAFGVTNVIASKDGVVVKSTKSSGISCSDSNGDLDCGGGYGNHVIIQHVDGNYTVYAHLQLGSIDIEMGESVQRGQVIGKVGDSGYSTGPHLHFEVRVGGNDSSSAQDPLNFVSSDNPRPSGASSQLIEWIGHMEGTGPIVGDSYQIYNDSGGVATVGHGITIKYNKDAFIAHGIDPNTLNVGSLVPIVTVDAIYEENVSSRMDNMSSMLASKGITLNEHQMAALVSLQFNCGNINGFFENYELYGTSEQLCSNWWENKALYDQNGNYLKGLKKRRIAECDLFVTGVYNMNVYG